MNVTYVPFRLGQKAAAVRVRDIGGVAPATVPAPAHDGIVGAEWRRPAEVSGTVEQLALHTSAGSPNLIAVIGDGTGTIDLLFLGRTEIGGIALGARVRARGTVINHRGRLTLMNPAYELTEPAPAH